MRMAYHWHHNQRSTVYRNIWQKIETVESQRKEEEVSLKLGNGPSNNRKKEDEEEQNEERKEEKEEKE